MAQTTPERILGKGLAKIAIKQGALERLRIEYVPIDSIKPNPYNPNRQAEKEFEMLRDSMREDGFTQPIVVQRASNEIVDGEHRWRAGRAEGLETVPVVFVDMTPEQMRVSTLRHNRARGAEDQDLSAQVLRDLRELGALEWAQHTLHLSDDEINALINDVPVSEALAAGSFTEGWAPVRNIGELQGRSEVSMSDEAKRLNEKLNDRMAAATTPTERAQVEQERRDTTLRISLVFEASDAEFIRTSLQPKPSARLLAMCQAYQSLEG
jgi:ParB/RepB/Spo0J family partition protein